MFVMMPNPFIASDNPLGFQGPSYVDRKQMTFFDLYYIITAIIDWDQHSFDRLISKTILLQCRSF